MNDTELGIVKNLFQMKKIERRNTIGWVIFSILFFAAALDYISYLLVFMISIPMMSAIIVMNTLDDKSLDKNTSRAVLLGVVLFFLSLNFYMNKIEDKKNIREAISLCYSESGNSSLCDNLDMILNPESISTDE